MNMRNGAKWSRVAAEAAVIFLVSATVGLLWNHSLLLRAWRGEAVEPAPVAAPAAGAAATAAADPMPLGLDQAKQLFDAGDTVFIDARDRASFTSGHLQGAYSLPLGEARRPTLPLPATIGPQTVIVTYCNGFSCHDSMELGKILLKAGYPTVYVYEGGFPEWRDAGYPVDKGGV